MGMNLFPALAALLLLAGCATHEFAQPGPSAKSAAGQLRYSGRGVTLIGELSATRSAAGSRVEFAKGPGLSLVRVLADSTHARIEGPLARGAAEFPLGGKALSAAAPERLRGWATVAERALGGSSGSFTVGSEQFSLQLPALR